MGEPLWSPSAERVESSQLTAFRRLMEAETGLELRDYAALQGWSVRDTPAFWEALWRFGEVIGERGSGPTLVDAERMPGARFFPDAHLSFAENLLRRSDDAQALVFQGEHGARSSLSYADLRTSVAALAASLRELGVVRGDRIGAYLPNIPESLIAMLAATSLGAIWSSCSPDFGVRGVIDRFGQIEPKILFAVDGYFYNGRKHDLGERVVEIADALPSLESIVRVSFADTPEKSRAGLGRPGRGAHDFSELSSRSDAPLDFERVPFHHPLYILYSSGTTGQPKCIVHGTGGTLLQHIKEHRLQCDLGRDDRLFYFTTCGWMMWNWLVGALASESSLVLYDGSPFHPGPEVLWDLADRERVDVFGTSAKYIDAVAKSGLKPIESHDLSSVRAILSTGSPLAPESFDFVYRSIKNDVWLSSISGGTDIAGCFVAGDPTGPVWRGEVQALALGMDIAVFDDEGNSLTQEKGELVCKKPFPSMPVGFWNDPGDERYRASYFQRYPDVWCHGDWVEITEHGGMIIYGRSDAVLNPGGVRIGTAEIYRPVEQLDQVIEGLVIGQSWQSDVRVVLFVKLREGLELDDDLRDEIRAAVRAHATPRHVPAVIAQVSDIPRTKSGKIVELAVRDVVHGRPVKNIDALANPETLLEFENRSELR
ncbi:MAG: acetoacetate--CoA ligase [bacterium]|nr:acetoacetate--CoA ligase [bacterium]